MMISSAFRMIRIRWMVFTSFAVYAALTLAIIWNIAPEFVEDKSQSLPHATDGRTQHPSYSTAPGILGPPDMGSPMQFEVMNDLLYSD